MTNSGNFQIIKGKTYLGYPELLRVVIASALITSNATSSLAVATVSSAVSEVSSSSTIITQIASSISTSAIAGEVASSAVQSSCSIASGVVTGIIASGTARDISVYSSPTIAASIASGVGTSIGINESSVPIASSEVTITTSGASSIQVDASVGETPVVESSAAIAASVATAIVGESSALTGGSVTSQVNINSTLSTSIACATESEAGQPASVTSAASIASSVASQVGVQISAQGLAQASILYLISADSVDAQVGNTIATLEAEGATVTRVDPIGLSATLTDAASVDAYLAPYDAVLAGGRNSVPDLEVLRFSTQTPWLCLRGDAWPGLGIVATEDSGPGTLGRDATIEPANANHPLILSLDLPPGVTQFELFDQGGVGSDYSETDVGLILTRFAAAQGPNWFIFEQGDTLTVGTALVRQAAFGLYTSRPWLPVQGKIIANTLKWVMGLDPSQPFVAPEQTDDRLSDLAQKAGKGLGLITAGQSNSLRPPEQAVTSRTEPGISEVYLYNSATDTFDPYLNGSATIDAFLPSYLAEDVRTLYPNLPIYIIWHGIPSTGYRPGSGRISGWNESERYLASDPDGLNARYQWFEDYFIPAIAKIAALGLDLEAFLVNLQGEWDGVTGPDPDDPTQYQREWTEKFLGSGDINGLVEELRQHIPNLPVIQGQLGSELPYSQIVAMRAAQQRAADEDNGVFIVDASGIDKNDSVHYSGSGYSELAQRIMGMIQSVPLAPIYDITNQVASRAVITSTITTSVGADTEAEASAIPEFTQSDITITAAIVTSISGETVVGDYVDPNMIMGVGSSTNWLSDWFAYYGYNIELWKSSPSDAEVNNTGVYWFDEAGGSSAYDSIRNTQTTLIIGEPYAWDNFDDLTTGSVRRVLATPRYTNVAPSHPITRGMGTKLRLSQDFYGHQAYIETSEIANNGTPLLNIDDFSHPGLIVWEAGQFNSIRFTWPAYSYKSMNRQGRELMRNIQLYVTNKSDYLTRPYASITSSSYSQGTPILATEGYTVTVQFSEPISPPTVNDFTLELITSNGIPANSVVDNGGNSYTVSFSLTSEYGIYGFKIKDSVTALSGPAFLESTLEYIRIKLPQPLPVAIISARPAGNNLAANLEAFFLEEAAISYTQVADSLVLEADRPAFLAAYSVLVIDETVNSANWAWLADQNIPVISMSYQNWIDLGLASGTATRSFSKVNLEGGNYDVLRREDVFADNSIYYGDTSNHNYRGASSTANLNVIASNGGGGNKRVYGAFREAGEILQGSGLAAPALRGLVTASYFTGEAGNTTNKFSFSNRLVTGLINKALSV